MSRCRELKGWQMRLAAGLRPDPPGELQCSSRPPSCNRGSGPSSKGRERKRERDCLLFWPGKEQMVAIAGSAIAIVVVDRCLGFATSACRVQQHLRCLAKNQSLTTRAADDLRERRFKTIDTEIPVFTTKVRVYLMNFPGSLLSLSVQVFTRSRPFITGRNAGLIDDSVQNI